MCAYGYLRRVLEILTRQPAKAQPRIRCGLKKEGADVCLFLAVAAYLDGIVGLDLDCAERLLVDELDDRPQKKVREYHKGRGKRTRHQLPGAGECPDHGRAPKCRRGVEAAHIDALAKDYPGAEKADARDDLGSDPGRAVVA